MNENLQAERNKIQKLYNAVLELQYTSDTRIMPIDTMWHIEQSAYHLRMSMEYFDIEHDFDNYNSEVK